MIDNLIIFSVGAIIAFTAFYQGIKIGQKLQQNKPITIMPTIKPKESKQEKKANKAMADDMSSLLGYDAEQTTEYYKQQRKGE